jgi:hypothetical protein
MYPLDNQDPPFQFNLTARITRQPFRVDSYLA